MDHDTRTNTCPENNASWLSRIFFTWPSSLLELGSKKILSNEDIPDLCPPCTCKTTYPRFEKEWEKELHASRYYDAVNTTQVSNGHVYHEKSPPDNGPRSSSNHTASLVWALLRTFRWRFTAIQFLHLLCFSLLWIAPIHLRTLISYVEKPWGGAWQGGVLVASLFLIQVLDSIFYQQFIYMRNKLEISTQNILMAAIFKKSLRLSSAGRKNYPIGKMLTLVSTDAAEAGLAFNYVSFSFLSPLNIVVVFVQLFLLLGPASALSLLGSLVLVITHIQIAGAMQKLLKSRMEKQDSRMKLLTEVLTGIKAIKLHAWEVCFGGRVTDRRDKELQVLSDVFLWKIPLLLSTTVAPFMVSALTLAMYVFWYDDVHLDAAIIFSTVSLLKILRRGLNMTPDFFHDLARLHTHVGRIQQFLLQDEQPQHPLEHKTYTDFAIQIKGGTFSWDRTIPPVLKDISVSVSRGGLVAVVGQVGEGKSSLINAILREMVVITGTTDVQGSIAYVPQQAWVQNDTLEQNILFGAHFDRERYDAVLEACALGPDLELLPGGDQTEIGEKGINLSGGQKQRVSLARAVYNDADIYLFDDPLSAVDSHVGKHIFDKVISNKGRLSDKTRVLVTHNVSVLSRVDTILVISNKCVKERGSYEELMSRNSVLKQVVSSSPVADIDQKSWDTENKPTVDQRVPAYKQNDSKQKGLGKLIEEESVGLGGMRMNVFSKFLNAFGSSHWLLIGGSYFLYYVTVSLANIWLSVWAEGTVHHNSTIHLTQGQKPSNTWYIGIYFALGILQAALVLGYSVVLKDFTVVASRKLHSNMLETVLKSPMKFFDTTPLGRITNRFSQDINTIDKELPFTFEIWMDSCFQTLCSMCIVFYSAPGVVILLIPLIYCCIVIQRYFISTSRQLKRAYVKSLSDVLSFFSETSQGVELIRAFKEHERFATRFVHLAETHQKFNYYNFISNRWLSMRLSFVCHVILASTALLIFLEGDAVSSGVMGLALSFAYETSNDLRMFIIRSTKLDLMSVSVEKIMEYASMETEVDCFNGGQSVPPTWPNQGDIRYRNFSLRYRSGLQLALHDINLSVKPGEKVGVVGRTGAGKSSMMLSLFRLIDPVEGAIVIDDINIADVQLSEVRSRLTIIPQDPMLFSETLRVNLDPIEAYDDQEIWTALRHAHLHTLVKSLPGQLLYKCQEGGKNFSIGQRQLLCLARTLLRKSKILVLDEATAAVDMETDDLIQQTIRSEFKDCTVLTIAHRLNTVMDYDRILVLNKGIVEAYDTPERLLQDTKGIFYALARHAGIV
ncbi:multidrug resistance-associated protein 1-like [Haliotis rufescens]|uniref:multidrug resistance-associated protein 1-like n=1 Tax=Haliotis rufescens TaxID=6454 RepID=UPI00201EBB7D|nr:multidrug resistance-associated protein 1-like [Haliotis rufescens]